jgi:hypothetical protein
MTAANLAFLQNSGLTIPKIGLKKGKIYAGLVDGRAALDTWFRLERLTKKGIR